MSLLLGVVVDLEALLDTAIAAIIAGVGITFAFSVTIYGTATFAEARRDGRLGAAGAAGLLALLGVLISASGIIAGILVMVS